VDDEFFFPQNVQTTYRLFGMGPRHLRRAALGLPVAVGLAFVLGRGHVLVGVLIATILAAAFVAAVCWPTNGDETVIDLWLHVRRMQREQTVFIKGEVNGPGTDRTDSERRSLRELLDLDGAGVADEPAPEERP
jgi:hypothetical protein